MTWLTTYDNHRWASFNLLRVLVPHSIQPRKKWRPMRYWWLIGLVLLLCTAAPAGAQISIGIGVPSLDIGIRLPALPSLTIVPGPPVYYAPRIDSNFFFYDGMYWVYQNDNWYASSWYNGPWAAVDPDIVPEPILRVPVRYYRRPPTYFRGWTANARPR